MSDTVRLRATVVVEYDAHPDHYDTDDPAEMAEIDQKNWQGDPMLFWSSFEDEEYGVTVEVASVPSEREGS
jgi:hypothetical protein